MTHAWKAVRMIGIAVLVIVLAPLTFLGLPFAILAALLFPRLISSPRQGKLGMEDVIHAFLRLSVICGIAAALLAVTLWSLGIHVVRSS